MSTSTHNQLENFRLSILNENFVISAVGNYQDIRCAHDTVLYSTVVDNESLPFNSIDLILNSQRAVHCKLYHNLCHRTAFDIFYVTSLHNPANLSDDSITTDMKVIRINDIHDFSFSM